MISFFFIHVEKALQSTAGLIFMHSERNLQDEDPCCDPTPN